jgi:arabinogalactan endo-1,4-beta-galactosidase
MAKKLIVSLPILLVLAVGVSAGASQDVAAPANPGFEEGGVATGSPAGWLSSGDRVADFTEAGGHSGGFRLSHWSERPYEVETTQRLRVSGDGWYTLRAWVRSSAGENESSIGLEDCGDDDAHVQVPVSNDWLQVVVSARLERGFCSIVLRTKAAASEWTNFDDVELVPGRARLSILGADVSSLAKSEDKGGGYRTASGRRGDALDILEDAGLNLIRLRVWVDPADGYHDKAELLELARRAKAQGLKVLVGLHYSDFWADPGKQWTPAAWEGQTFDELLQTFTSYTRDIVASLVGQGTPPDLIQLGNEINPGLLWDYAGTWEGTSCADDGLGSQRCVFHHENWDNLARLLTAGYGTVKSASPSTRVMLHLAEGGSNGTFRWWFDNVTTRNVPFDVIGASFYGYWHGSLAQLQFNLNDVAAHYGKDVVVVETAYPFTLADKDGWANIIDLPGELVAGYPASPKGQREWVRDVMSVVRAVPDGRGLGIVYWDATWTGVPGNGWSPRDPASGNAWENQALFDFDDRLLPAMREFRP